MQVTVPLEVAVEELVGTQDILLKRIEAATTASIMVRGNTVFLEGSDAEVALVAQVLEQLLAALAAGRRLEAHDIDLAFEQARQGSLFDTRGAHEIFTTHRGRTVRAKTQGQERYVEAMETHTITFAQGPAGCGKTYLACAMALKALKRKEVSRIVLTRPVVEAGESLGYLPGTLEEKLDPYVRPLYDALFDMCDMEKTNVLIEQGIIEIAPLAFMRGRTLNDAFVILDEAQNTTPEQMKMFLTRLGFGSRFVITGDASQRDVLGTTGLESAQRTLEGIDDIAFCELTGRDCVRHVLVGKIVSAYERAGEGAQA